MVRNISCEETSHLIFSIVGSPPESPSVNPPGAGTIGFETEYQVGHNVPPDILIGMPASLLLRACYPRPCLVLSDISRREPLETAASLYTVAIGHKEADACRTRDSRFVSMRTATSWIFLGGGCLKSTPEEKVRQRFIETLINEYHYPANTIRREVPIQHGSKELRDKDGNPVRADIVVYASKAACLNANGTRWRTDTPSWSRTSSTPAPMVASGRMVTARSSTGERTRTAFKSSRRPPVCRGAVKDGRMGGLRA